MATAEKIYSIYVLEISPGFVPDARQRPDAAGYLYVGWTTNTVEHRRATHASGLSPAATIFKRVVEKLGRPLEPSELVVRADLATEETSWSDEGSANRAERRQANKLEARGYVILSRHKHGLRSKRNS